jgi:signal transduction histidine kinase/DNA-binding response OmpR family regulator
MFEPDTLRGKSLRLDIGVAALTALIVVVSIWYVFDVLQERFVRVNVADASNVNIFIDSQLSSAQEQLVLLASLPPEDRQKIAQRRFDAFSDLYQLDANAQITKIYKATTDSQVFLGYAFTAGPIWTQLLQERSAVTLSSLVAGYEDGSPSVYVAVRSGDNTIVGRLNLDYIRSLISQYSKITGNVLLLTTNKGVVMVSGQPDITLPRIDLIGPSYQTAPNQIEVNNQGWIPVVNDSEVLDARLVVLVSTELLDEQRNTLLTLLAVILAGLTFLIALKSRKLRQDVLLPIGALITRIRAMEVGHPMPPINQQLSDLPREFREINQHFESMAQAIDQREKALAQAAAAIQQQESELRLILQHVPIPLIVFDSGMPMTVTFVNSTFIDVFGYTNTEINDLVNLFSHSCQNPATASNVARQVNQMVRNHAKDTTLSQPIEVSIACRSGVHHDVIIAAISLNNSAIATFTDVTALRTSQRELLNAKLLAENQERQQAAFLAMMSHEIRTPLTSILGITQLLSDEQLTARQRDLVARLVDVDNLLLRIVNDVLDHSKIAAGELRLESTRFSVSLLLQKCERMFAELAKEKGIGLRCEVSTGCPEWLVGDALRLEQVLSNLVGNAIKFTDHGDVHVRLCCVHKQDSQVDIRVEVKDTGIGIPSDIAPLLFTPFKQLDNAGHQRVSGTGLGLSISKRLIELMGGSIGFDSHPNTGSTFWFELSLAPALAPTPASLTLENNPLTRLDTEPLINTHILVVEDSRAIRFLVNEILSSLGMRVTVANDGQDALPRLREHGSDFDAVLMDIQMPNMDGIECTRAIRNDPSLAAVPIIAMTASLVGPQRDEIMAAGANAVLSKPLNRDPLIRCLLEHIQSAAWRAFPHIEGIDRNHAMQTMSHDCDLFKRLLKIFIQENRQVAELTLADLERADRSSAAQRMHGLRGGASQVGAIAIRDLAQEIEHCILKANDVPVQRIRALEAEFAKIQASANL